MLCAWKELLSCLPGWLADSLDKPDREGLQELRLRVGQPPQMVCTQHIREGSRHIAAEDLLFCVNTACRYSPWAISTASKGYLTAPGGHRIGLCGEGILKKGDLEGIKNLTSLCIRVARDFPGIGDGIPQSGSLLILGAPGWGKTTLLRDLIRIRSNRGYQVAVVDERGELFPSHIFPTGRCTDVLFGCSKETGIPMLLRTMGPHCIAVDEITQEEDCRALSQAAGCGVTLMATVHASSIQDLKQRPVYRALLAQGIFDTAVVLHKDKSWRLERISA